MNILEETAQLVKQKLGSNFDDITIERVVIGLFFTGVKLSGNAGGVWIKKPDDLLDVLAAGGFGYHFFDRLASRIVMEKP